MRTLLCLTLLILLAKLSLAQEMLDTNATMPKLQLRHIAGMPSIEVALLSTPYAPGCVVAYKRLIKNDFGYFMSLRCEQGNIGLTALETVYLQGGLEHLLFDYRQRWLLLMHYGCLIGGEQTVNHLFENSIGTFDYGLTLGIGSECYLLNRLAFCAEVNQMADWGSKLGILRAELRVGLQFYY